MRSSVLCSFVLDIQLELLIIRIVKLVRVSELSAGLHDMEGRSVLLLGDNGS